MDTSTMSMSVSSSTNNINYEIEPISENNIKKELDNDNFEALLVMNKEFKIEIEEMDLKKECFNDAYEDLLGHQPNLGSEEAEEKFPPELKIGIENIAKQEQVTKEQFLTAIEKNSIDFKNDVSLLEDPLFIQDKELYKCNLCKSAFINETFLKSHECIDENKTFFERDKDVQAGDKPCNVFYKPFSDFEFLQRHKHSRKEQLYSCIECKVSYRNEHDLNKHRLIHTREKPNLCNNVSEKSEVGTPEPNHTTVKPFACNVCNESFTNLSFLVCHIRSHPKKEPDYYKMTPYSCDICKTYVKTLRDLRKHQRFHSEGGNYSCDSCTRLFRHRSSLVYHTRNAH